MHKTIKKAVDKCASFSSDACIFDHPCRVLEGKRCGYFEAAVLPDPENGEARLQYSIAHKEK